MSQKKRRRLLKEVTEPKVNQKRIMLVIKDIVVKNWLFLGAMTLLTVVIYWNSLWGNFVSDDYASITQNSTIGSFGSVNWNTMSLGTYLIYKLFGLTSSIPYHVFSLIHFIIFCWVAYILLEVIFENRWLTGLTMGLFVVHPIHVEAVSWISGRVYLILGIYILLGLLGFVCFIKENNPRYLLVTLFSFILAFLTDKPRPFAMLLLIIVYLISYGAGKVKVNWGKLILGSLAVVIVALIVAWPYILNRINIVNAGYNSTESIFYNPFFQYPTGISKYLQLLMFPVDLTLYHTMYIFPGWLNWSILLVYLGMMIYFGVRNKPYFFALAFIIAGVLPSIMPIKVSWLVAERYLFLGSLGFCLFLGLVIMDLSRYLKLVTPIIIASLVSFYGVRLFLRNIDWQTNHNLWVNTCQVSPNSHNAWNNIGDDYDKLAQYDNAVKGFTQSTIVKPNYADAYHNRANIFYKMGRLDLARASYETALVYSPSLYQTYLSLINIDLTEKKTDLALLHTQKSLELQPNDPGANYVLAVVYVQRNELDKAKLVLEGVLRVYPDFKQAADALAQIKTMLTK